MNAIELIDSFSEFKEIKNIDRVTMMRIVEDVFRSTLKRKYGSDENVDVIINPDKGDLEIWLSREIVKDEEFEDEGTQIKYSEALKIEPDFEIGEEVSQEIKVEDFGRRNNRRTVYIFEIDQDITTLLSDNDLLDSDGDGSSELVNIDFLSVLIFMLFPASKVDSLTVKYPEDKSR